MVFIVGCWQSSPFYPDLTYMQPNLNRIGSYLALRKSVCSRETNCYFLCRIFLLSWHLCFSLFFSFATKCGEFNFWKAFLICCFPFSQRSYFREIALSGNCFLAKIRNIMLIETMFRVNP